MPIPGNLLTTAMAVMPQTDVPQALDLALSLDVPFWPQLPNFSYYEDMYVQAAEHFPGIVLNVENKTLRFAMDKFIDEFEDTMSRMDDPAYFDISEQYSVVYHDFFNKRSCRSGCYWRPAHLPVSKWRQYCGKAREGWQRRWSMLLPWCRSD